MIYAVFVSLFVSGFVAGILVERRNQAHMEAAINEVKQAVADIKARTGK